MNFFLMLVMVWASSSGLSARAVRADVSGASYFPTIKESLQPTPQGFIYRIRANETLSEISVRLFGTTQMWRKIARWNHMEAPYVIRAGKDVKIKKAPTISLAQGDERLRMMWRKRFMREESRALAQTQSHQSEQRQAPAHFEVNEDTRTLSEVSIVVYGNDQHWQEIATWNQIEAPFRIRPGQDLRLEKKPTLTLKEGNAKLLEMWRHHFSRLPENSAKKVSYLERTSE